MKDSEKTNSQFASDTGEIIAEVRSEATLLKAGALQSAIFNSANFSSIATDAKGVIQIFNVGAERMLGYTAAEVMNKITPADISDPQEVIARAKELSVELDTPITPGFEALVFKASRGIEDIYELTYIRKDGSRFPAVVSVTALRDAQDAIIGYLLIGTDNTARKQAEEALLKAGALQSAIFNSANFSSIATDAKGVIQIFNVGAERMLGYTAAEVMNKITPADISDPQEVIARAEELSLELDTPIKPGFEALVFKASRGIEDIYELTYIRKDGSRFPAVVSVTALRDEQGAIIGYLLIGTDNTARKQAEEALLKAGALQSAIFNSANFSSIATDAKGVIQIFNVGAERMLGYTAAEVMNKITPADISDPQEVIARAKELSVELDTPITPGFEALVFKASRGIEDIYELTYIRKDGSCFPAVVSVTALRDEQGAIIGYLLIGTDNTARKQIEEEQKQLSQRLRDHQFYTRSLFESNIDAIMTTDPSGIITDVNKQMEVLTGCTHDELIGAPFKNYFSDPDRAETSIKHVLIEKKVTNYELTARARDGKETVVSINATTFYDRDRKLQGVFAAARDVTERKRLDQVLLEKNVELERLLEDMTEAKQALEAANEKLEELDRLKSLFIASTSHELRTPLNSIIGFTGILLQGLAGPLNDEQRKQLGMVKGSSHHLLELITDIIDLSKIEAGKLSLNMESFDLAQTVRETLETFRVAAGRKALSLEVEGSEQLMVRSDIRRVRQVLVNLIGNAVKFTGKGGVSIDVAEENGTAVVAVRDCGSGIRPGDMEKLFRYFSQILDANQPALRGTFGYELEDIRGRSTRILYADEADFVRVCRELSCPGDSTDSRHIEANCQRKDGTMFQGETSALPLIGDDGTPSGNIVVIRDITAQKKLEAQLHQAQKMESIGTLAGGVAHDFNNILTAIIGFGYITLMEMGPDDPLRRNIEHILEGADRAAQLTKDLLLFSRKHVSEKRPVDLNEIIGKVEKFLVRVIGEDINCSFALHNEPIVVYADPHQLEQVLMNLATNARDSMAKSGVLIISAEKILVENDFVTIHGYGKPGRYALLTISDTGEGMDEETRQKIFDPFFTTKEVGKGTGLGLAVVYGIIKEHEGFINVYSEPGAGTTFRIYLPVISSEVRGAEIAPEKETLAKGTETILLVEDDETVRNLISIVLKQEGYTVIEAVDGVDSVKKFMENRETIDLLLSDLIMPKMNGIEAYDEMKVWRPGLKAIFVSGYAPEVIRQKMSLESGVELISKPILPYSLLKKVRNLLDEEEEQDR